MTLKSKIKNLMNSVTNSYDYTIVHNSLLYEWQKYPQAAIPNNDFVLPDDANEYLDKDNPRLKELIIECAKYNRKFNKPLIWTKEYIDKIDLKYFRSDNPYVWQLRGSNQNYLSYALVTYYMKAIDKRHFLEKLEEDNLFGVNTFTVDSKLVSRDLLDSINEIYFLDEHLNLYERDNLSVLDIGAGYGRLAHRMARALPNLKYYYCTDAIATSTFISEYYTKFRKIENKAKVIPWSNIKNCIENKSVDIAINIHSFSEMTIPEIEGWLSLIQQKKVQYLFIKPNNNNCEGKSLQINTGIDFSHVIEKYGYRLRAKQPTYKDEVVQKYGISSGYHYLYEQL